MRLMTLARHRQPALGRHDLVLRSAQKVICGGTHRMNESTRERIVASPRLPTMPTVAMEVLEFTQAERVDLRKAAAVIQNDQAIAGKVLRTVNSSYYGLTRPCATIKQALVYLGANTVRTLVLGFALVDSMKDGDGNNSFDYMDYWRRDLYVAVAARELARLHQQCDPDEAFLGGLMQDIGMVAMYRVLGSKYTDAIALTNGDHRKLPKAERDAFETDHAEIGAEIARRWKFPDQFISCIEHHHHSSRAALEHEPIVRSVELANCVAHILNAKESDGPKRILLRDASGWFQIAQKDIQTLLSTVVKAANELSHLFKINIGKTSDLEDLLATAEDRLVHIQTELERENQALRENNVSLSQQTISDALTGVANRKHFDELLESHFSAAHTSRGCLAVVFCDLDHFKSINDTHGHQAGDCVLSEVGRIMREFIGTRGIVARYGGEEFAIIIPDGDRVTATEIAEHLRVAICARPIALNGTSQHAEEVPVTMSLGVAALEPELATIMRKPQQLLKVADQAVYAAKKGGRNCVRTYNNRRVQKQSVAA